MHCVSQLKTKYLIVVRHVTQRKNLPSRKAERVILQREDNSPSKRLTKGFVSKTSNSSMCSPVPMKITGLFVAATLHPTSNCNLKCFSFFRVAAKCKCH
jgi:hypothetical protein